MSGRLNCHFYAYATSNETVPLVGWFCVLIRKVSSAALYITTIGCVFIPASDLTMTENTADGVIELFSANWLIK